MSYLLVPKYLLMLDALLLVPICQNRFLLMFSYLLVLKYLLVSNVHLLLTKYLLFLKSNYLLVPKYLLMSISCWPNICYSVDGQLFIGFLLKSVKYLLKSNRCRPNICWWSINNTYLVVRSTRCKQEYWKENAYL